MLMTHYLYVLMDDYPSVFIHHQWKLQLFLILKLAIKTI